MSTCGIDDATLTVLLDLRHPFAYLALAPTMEFARTRGVAVNWLPLSVPPLNPPSTPGPDDDRGIRHRRARAQAIAREIETYAAAQGLVLKDPYRSDPADAAHRAWLWVRETAPEQLEPFLVSLFHAYWAGALPADDPEQVAILLDASKLDAPGYRAWLESGAGPKHDRALADELRERGLFQVPGYVVEDEVFFGRQHLPMIEWILGGRVGRGPI